jgi:hypothetical protein
MSLSCSAIQASRLVERFQSSNHMGCSKRPHSVDGRPKKRLSGFTIRHLVEQALRSSGGTSKRKAQKASEMADRAAEHIVDKSAAR